MSFFEPQSSVLNVLNVPQCLLHQDTLSNELFGEWAHGLVNKSVFHSASQMNSKIESLCLGNTCSKDAVSALMAITQELGQIKVRCAGGCMREN